MCSNIVKTKPKQTNRKKLATINYYTQHTHLFKRKAK